MKRFRMLIAIALISCMMVMNVSASQVHPYDSSGSNATAVLGVADGEAVVQVVYNGTPDITNLSFYIHLKRDGVTFMSWIVPVSDYDATIMRTAGVTSGHTYQAEVVCFVYSPRGNFNFTLNSNSVSY